MKVKTKKIVARAKYKPRECVICHKQYLPASSTQKYCKECANLPCFICGARHYRFVDGVSYCLVHYNRLMNGKSLYGIRCGDCYYYISGDVCYMTTANGYTVVFDAEDYDKVCKYSWWVDSGTRIPYVLAKYKGKHVKMHRIIMGVTDPNIVVDHINHDPRDNRKCNLRLCTVAENNKNRISNNKSCGVETVKSKDGTTKYRAWISENSKIKRLEVCDTYEEAMMMREEAVDKNYGKFANKNSPKVEKIPYMILPKPKFHALYDYPIEESYRTGIKQQALCEWNKRYTVSPIIFRLLNED